MSLDSLIMLSGAFVALLPFLGFPNSWDTALLLLAGIFIISLGITVRRMAGHSQSAEQNKKTASSSDTNTLPPPHENS